MQLRHISPAAGLLGLRVLVVEDEALVAMLLEEWLRDAGVRVVGPARSVEEALTLIAGAERDGGLDAAVLDIRLLGGDVSPVADRLAGLAVPFVFSTGWEAGCAHGVYAGAPVLVKPFHPDALVVAVAGLSRRSRGMAARRQGSASAGRATLGVRDRGVDDIGRGAR